MSWILWGSEILAAWGVFQQTTDKISYLQGSGATAAQIPGELTDLHFCICTSVLRVGTVSTVFTAAGTRESMEPTALVHFYSVEEILVLVSDYSVREYPRSASPLRPLSYISSMIRKLWTYEDLC